MAIEAPPFLERTSRSAPPAPANDPGPIAEAFAIELENALRLRKPVAPLSERGVDTIEQAYAIQRAWSRNRIAEGDVVLGRKIGLTSEGIRNQMGVREPDFGSLWASRQAQPVDRIATFPAGTFIQPKVEVEFAFLLKRDLDEPPFDRGAVIRATDAIAIAMEVVDSRIRDWRIRITDTVADNASYGGFVLAPWTRLIKPDMLDVARLCLEQNGKRILDETGAAVMGHPADAVAWLAATFNRLGTSLRAGEIILSGSLGAAADARPGDRFLATAGSGAQALQLAFEEEG